MRAFSITIVVSAALLAAREDSPNRRPRHSIARNKQANPPIDSAAVNAKTSEPVGFGFSGPSVVRIQILLDRAHFSPGEIDGHYGDNLRIALIGYQSSRGLNTSGIGDSDTWESLNADTGPMLFTYKVTSEDLKGPFIPVPSDLMAEAKLPALGYTSLHEELGERFHLNPKLLEALNPGKHLSLPGEQILAPNDNHEAMPRADRIVVSNSNRTVTAYAADGTKLAQYPATMGSEHDPLPIGNWKVVNVEQNPWFNYSPKLFWDASSKDVKARIAPGPNNPVGVVWIGLSKQHYGIHGTPRPENIGHTESHGCIRLTNWDAEELSTMVKRGTPAILEE